METIQIKTPEGKNKCLLWEYDLTGKKPSGLFGLGGIKFKVATAPSTGAFLYNATSKRFAPVHDVIELKKGEEYRLFGMITDCRNVLTDTSEFRGKLQGDCRLVWGNQTSGEKTTFMAPLIIIGQFGYGKVINGVNFIKAHMEEVSPTSPLYADYMGNNGFNARQYFHDTIKPRLFSFIEMKIGEYSTGSGLAVSALERIKNEANVYATRLSKEVYDADKENAWCEISCNIGTIEPVGEIYETIKRNFNAAAQHISNADVLEGQLKATKVARAIQRELED